MKYIVIVFILFFGLSSCDSENEYAKELCDCYTQLHRANSESEVNFWGDSCNTLYINIIEALEDNPSKKEEFNKAYSRCQ